MSPTEVTQLVKRLALQAGFDLCGIASAAPIPRGEFFQDWLSRGYAGTMGYLHRQVESRMDVRNWLPSARSVIVVALNYRQSPPLPADTDTEYEGSDRSRGRVAMYAWGEDYHTVVPDKLNSLLMRLREEIGEPFEAHVCCDTSAIIERELAAMSGLGWIGKNTMVLHPGLGSYFFLGEIITDLPLTPDGPMPDHCGTCTRCLEACPTQAFPEPYVMDARRCISYLTIEHRSEIDPSLGANMGEWVFGCDICQDVCPHNRRAPYTDEPRFQAGSDAARPNLDAIVAWTEEEYQRHVQGKATDRARYGMWRRNARIALQNQAK